MSKSKNPLKGVKIASDPDEDFRLHAFRLGLQYLGAGRLAVAARFTPASGNLLHHAIEMFLKGSLAKLIGVAQIPHHHQLETLWNLYRQHHADPALDQYTTLIEALHRFEGIRYPDKLIKEGGLLSVGFPASTKTVQTAGKKLPEYHLVVAHIDTLVKELFARDKLNPDFFGS